MKNLKNCLITGTALIGIFLFIFIPIQLYRSRNECNPIERTEWLINSVSNLDNFTPVMNAEGELPEEAANVRIQFQKEGTFTMTQQMESQIVNNWNGKYTKKAVTADGVLLDLLLENGTSVEAVCGETKYLNGARAETLILTTDHYIVTFLGK